MSVKGKAIVEVTLQINLTDCWGDECTLRQIYIQAKNEAMAIMFKLFEEYKSSEKISILGTPKITSIISEKE